MPPTSNGSSSRRPARSPEHVVQWHATDEITWVERGETRIQVEGRVLRATTDTAVYVPAGLEHRVRLLPGTVVEPIFIPEQGLLGSSCLTISRGPELDDAAARLLARRAPQSVGAATLDFTRVLAKGSRGYPKLPAGGPALTAARAVRESCHARLSLNDLAARTGVSERTLQRAFHAQTGMSFTEWRRAWCLAEANRLLSDGASVSEAAAACGYTPSALISSYRSAYGETPGQASAHRR